MTKDELIKELDEKQDVALFGVALHFRFSVLKKKRAGIPALELLYRYIYLFKLF